MTKLTFAVIGATLLAAAPACAEDLTITLINNSGATMTHFYTSPVDVNDWEEDVFGDGVMPDGNQVDVNIRDGRDQCDYDIKVIFDDGTELTDSANLCEMDSYIVAAE